MSRIALCTMMDDNFLNGFVAFIKSFLKRNSWFDYDFVVLDVGLSDQTKEVMKSYYNNIIFKQPNTSSYKKIDMSKTADSLKKTYYTLDIFKYEEYDRIVFIDMDTIVLDDLTALFECPAGFAACLGYSAGLDELRADINSGVFVVNKPYIGKEIFARMIDIARPGYSMPDQKVINIFFKGKISYLEKVYNVEKRMLHSKKHKHTFKTAKILHFIATKPWQDHSHVNDIENSFGDVEKIWWGEYNG